MRWTIISTKEPDSLHGLVSRCTATHDSIFDNTWSVAQCTFTLPDHIQGHHSVLSNIQRRSRFALDGCCIQSSYSHRSVGGQPQPFALGAASICRFDLHSWSHSDAGASPGTLCCRMTVWEGLSKLNIKLVSLIGQCANYGTRYNWQHYIQITDQITDQGIHRKEMEDT